ncbi:MAG: ATP-binding protein [Anaerolineales bacterium]|nr:ATP-binding protein [Anaerolineales bacterium]
MKLTWKLILAFLLVSLFGIVVIVAFTHIATDREFNKFINDRYKAELVIQLETYYSEHRTWIGIEQLFTRFGGDHSKPAENRPLFFSIADADGIIIIAGNNRRVGEVVSTDELKASAQIQVENKTVGILLLKTPPDRNPLESEFLRRLNGSVFLSAFGAVFLALILGAIVSRTVTRPIRELTSATHAMANGDLNQQVPVRSRDEIGELAAAFNKMSGDLARSFNLRKQMTADIAHELRTPLSLIIGHAEGVHDGVLKPTRENFEIIREEAERLEHLVNDLRTLSLADAGELALNFQLVDINKLISDIHAHHLYQFNQKRITLDVSTTLNTGVEPAPVILKADLDPARFTQVLTNILDNALHYTPEGGRVVIATRQSGDQVEVAIQDNGPGVTADEATRIFERFYRIDSSRARDDGGSGLGLAIAKSIIEMHKGKIWAESEKGEGVKVVIQLPMTKG